MTNMVFLERFHFFFILIDFFSRLEGVRPTVGDIGAGVGQFGEWLESTVNIILFLFK